VRPRSPRPAARWWRLAALAALVLLAVAAGQRLGVGDLLRAEGLARLRQSIDELGTLGRLAFLGGYVLAVVAFVPALPLTALSGLLFGPLWGTLYASAGSTIGACLAFLIARYAARDLVQGWVAASPALARLDQGAARHGVRLVMITRLVPLFPFNVQNYVYGITAIRFAAYAITSWVCMLPATVAVTLATGSVGGGGWDVRWTLPWLALAVLAIALSSLLPRWLRRRSPAFDELLGSDR